jgi:hypothetical protein
LNSESNRFFDCALRFSHRHIYADYERSLVEQELGGYGIDLDDLRSVPPDGGALKRRR